MSQDISTAEFEPSTAVQSGLPGYIQRVLDIAIALVAIVLFAPLLLLLAVTVCLSDGGPAFFGHTRIGHMGRPFRCWKFRSMVVNSQEVLERHLAQHPHARAEWAADHKLRNDPRITQIGRLLRASSLDELPQLWNVLVGEMSLVGPRPIVEAEVARYRFAFHDYCACRPGITGLWQISGRNDVSYATRVKMDVDYVRNKSLYLYLKIIVLTIPAVLTRRGSY